MLALNHRSPPGRRHAHHGRPWTHVRLFDGAHRSDVERLQPFENPGVCLGEPLRVGPHRHIRDRSRPPSCRPTTVRGSAPPRPRGKRELGVVVALVMLTQFRPSTAVRATRGIDATAEGRRSVRRLARRASPEIGAIARAGQLLELAAQLGRDDHAQMRRVVFRSHLRLSALSELQRQRVRGDTVHARSVTAYRVGYFVGSLASDSINRKLAAALVRLAPSNMEFTEIPIRDLPLYSRDYDDDFPPEARALKEAITSVDALLFVTPEYNRGASWSAKERDRLGEPPVWDQLVVTEAVSHDRRIDGEARHSDCAAEPPQRPQLLQRASDERPGGVHPVDARSHHR